MSSTVEFPDNPHDFNVGEAHGQVEFVTAWAVHGGSGLGRALGRRDVFTLGAISLGPSLMVVLRNTTTGGRRQGVMCALGHGLGFGMYAGLAVFGLIVLLEEAPTVFTGLQLIGCALLVWYGVSMWNANHDACSTKTPVRAHKALLKGLRLRFSIQKSPCSSWLCSPRSFSPT